MNYIPVFICIAALCGSFLLGYTPLIIPSIYLLLSLVTLLFYAIDKSAARKGDSRVAENTLHALALAGGWPGAIIGQQMLRHKTIKTSFRIPFWITVLVNSGALGWLHTGQGAIFLNTCIFNAEDLVINHIGNGTARTLLLELLSFH